MNAQSESLPARPVRLSALKGQRWALRFLAGLVLTLPAVASHAVPISSEVRLRPSVSITNGSFDGDSPELTLSQAETLETLAGSLSATASVAGDTATTATDVAATWVDAGRGTVTFAESWRTTSNDGDGRVTGSLTPGGGFRYTFTAEADGEFSVAYDIATNASPDLFGLNLGFTILFQGMSPVTTTGSDGPGSTAFDVLAGNTYRFDIRSGGIGGNIGIREMSRTGVFNWNGPIESALPPPVSVAEPGTLGLLATSLLALGFVRRRPGHGRAADLPSRICQPTN